MRINVTEVAAVLEANGGVRVERPTAPPDTRVDPWAVWVNDEDVGSPAELAAFVTAIRESATPLLEDEPRNAVLRLAWMEWPDFIGRCPACAAGIVLGHGGGGLLSMGDIVGNCDTCGASCRRKNTGFHFILRGLAWALRDSPFRCLTTGFGTRFTLLPSHLSRAAAAMIEVQSGAVPNDPKGGRNDATEA